MLHAARHHTGSAPVDVALAARALGDSLPHRHLSVAFALPHLSGAARRDGAIPRSLSCRSGRADGRLGHVPPVSLSVVVMLAHALTPQTNQAKP